MEFSRFDGHPVDIVSVGVFGKDALVLDQDGAYDRRLVGMADVRQVIRDEAKLVVGVDERVGRLGHGHQRQGVVGALDVILDHYGKSVTVTAEEGHDGISTGTRSSGGGGGAQCN